MALGPGRECVQPPQATASCSGVLRTGHHNPELLLAGRASLKASGQLMPSSCGPTALQGWTPGGVTVAQASPLQVSSCHHPAASNSGGMGQMNASFLAPGTHEVPHVTS